MLWYIRFRSGENAALSRSLDDAITASGIYLLMQKYGKLPKIDLQRTPRTDVQSWRRVVSTLTTFIFGGAFWTLAAADTSAVVRNLLLGLCWLSLAWMVFDSSVLEKCSVTRRVLVTAAILIVTGALAVHFLWTPTRDQVISHMKALVKAKSWGQLQNELADLEGNQAFRDVLLYFRGHRYYAQTSGPDPEQTLSLVPPDSSLFEDAQWLRLASWARKRNSRSAMVIAASMEKAGYDGPPYIALRLVDPRLTYREIADLYRQFAYRYRNAWDFSEMKAFVRMMNGSPMHVDFRDQFAMPDVLLWFYFRLLWAAHSECLETEKNATLVSYDNLRAKAKPTLNLLHIRREAIYQQIAVIRNLPLPVSRCRSASDGGAQTIDP